MPELNLIYNVVYGVLLILTTFLFFKEFIKSNSSTPSNIFMEILIILAGLRFIVYGSPELSMLILILTSVMFNFYVAFAIATRLGRRIKLEVLYLFILYIAVFSVTQNIVISWSIFGLVLPIAIMLGFWRIVEKLNRLFEGIILSVVFILSLVALYEDVSFKSFGMFLLAISLLLSLATVIIVYNSRELLANINHKKLIGTDETGRKVVHMIFAIAIITPFYGVIIPMEIVGSFLSGFLELILQKRYLITGLRLIIILVGGSLLPVILAFEKMRLSGDFVLYSDTLLREIEKKNIATHVYFLISMFVIAVFFSEVIFIVSVASALIIDAISAVIGMKYGKKEIMPNRTLEGSFAGFIAGFILIGLSTGNFLVALLTALVITIVDIFHLYLKIDDNLLFPNLIALMLYFLW